MRICKPKLPLSQTEFAAHPRLRDADGRLLDPQEVAWVAREASAAPELCRALREAIDEIEAGMGNVCEPTEDQIALLGRLCEALGPAEVRRYRKIWKPR